MDNFLEKIDIMKYIFQAKQKRNFKFGKYRKWDEDDMKTAVNNVTENHMTVSQAARESEVIIIMIEYMLMTAHLGLHLQEIDLYVADTPSNTPGPPKI
mgnify:CR=1 FL=1